MYIEIQYICMSFIIQDKIVPRILCQCVFRLKMGQGGVNENTNFRTSTNNFQETPLKCIIKEKLLNT